jgi:WD40 repeat protein
MGMGRSGPGVLSSRFRIRRRACWANLFLRAARFFRRVALTRKPPSLGIVRMCSHLHYSKNLRGFRAFSGKPPRRTVYHAWFRARPRGGIQLWKLADQREQATIKGHSNVDCAAISPNGRFVARGGDDAIVRVWDLNRLLAADGAEKPEPRVLRSLACIVHTRVGRTAEVSVPLHQSGDKLCENTVNPVELWKTPETAASARRRC